MSWEVCDLAVELMKARQQVTDIGTLMQQESLFLPVMDNCHAKDADRAAKVFDVECCSKCGLELASPFKVTAEYQHIIHVDNDVDHEGWGNQRIAGAVALELV